MDKDSRENTCNVVLNLLCVKCFSCVCLYLFMTRFKGSECAALFLLPFVNRPFVNPKNLTLGKQPLLINRMPSFSFSPVNAQFEFPTFDTLFFSLRLVMKALFKETSTVKPFNAFTKDDKLNSCHLEIFLQQLQRSIITEKREKYKIKI